MTTTEGDVFNPATGELVGSVRVSTPEEVTAAIDRAVGVQRLWARTHRHERYTLMRTFADVISANRIELGTLLALESGKPLGQGFAEVDAVARVFRGFGERLIAMSEEAFVLDSQPGLEGDLLLTTRKPLGVVAAILPFNFPLELFAHKSAPAIAMGNTVVVKSSPEDPLTAVRALELLIDAGLPDNVIQIVQGGGDVGAALVSDPRVAGVAFTGSTRAGIHIALSSAKSLKRVILELGGNDALIIMDDADIDMAVDQVVLGRVVANGQVCCANKRILVDARIADEVTEKIIERFGSVPMGNPLDDETVLGPLIHETAAINVEKQVNGTIAAGAKVAVGGSRDGCFYTPTVLTQVDPSMDIARDMEIFGPVLPILPYTSVDEAVAIANQSRYGLGGSVFSRDVQKATRVAMEIEAGYVVVNGTSLYRADVSPFGGTKDTGNGREGFATSLEEYSETRSVVLRGFLS